MAERKEGGKKKKQKVRVRGVYKRCHVLALNLVTIDCTTPGEREKGAVAVLEYERRGNKRRDRRWRTKKRD